MLPFSSHSIPEVLVMLKSKTKKAPGSIFLNLEMSFSLKSSKKTSKHVSLLGNFALIKSGFLRTRSELLVGSGIVIGELVLLNTFIFNSEYVLKSSLMSSKLSIDIVIAVALEEGSALLVVQAIKVRTTKNALTMLNFKTKYLIGCRNDSQVELIQQIYYLLVGSKKE